MSYKNDTENFNQNTDQTNNENLDQNRHHHHKDDCHCDNFCKPMPYAPYYPMCGCHYNYPIKGGCPMMYGYQSQSMSYGYPSPLMRDDEDSEGAEDSQENTRKCSNCYPYYKSCYKPCYPCYPYCHGHHCHHRSCEMY